MNPSRRGIVGQLVAHVCALGTEPITGKPYKPTTQGKNERFHQTLFRYLDKQPLAEDLEQLQTQVDAFDHIYNTQRTHQGLPGRVTPEVAWLATAKADPPRPLVERPVYTPPAPVRHPRLRQPADLPEDTQLRKISHAATIRVDQVVYKLDIDHAYKMALVITEGTHPGAPILITDLDGQVIGEHLRPEPGITYVGNGRPPGTRPKNREVSPKS